MTVTLAPIKPVLRIEEVCACLGISRMEFYRLKARGWFGSDGAPALVEVLPPLNSEPRYLGEPFAKWLDGKHQARLQREFLREGTR